MSISRIFFNFFVKLLNIPRVNVGDQFVSRQNVGLALILTIFFIHFYVGLSLFLLSWHNKRLSRSIFVLVTAHLDSNAYYCSYYWIGYQNMKFWEYIVAGTVVIQYSSLTLYNHNNCIFWKRLNSMIKNSPPGGGIYPKSPKRLK